MSHGWVNPLASGAVARCGGPGLCRDCATETCLECGHTGLACHRFAKTAPGVVRTGITHELKSWPKQFASIRDGSKPFDVRVDDGRNFSVGDAVAFKLFDPATGAFGGSVEVRLITYVYRSLLEDSPLRIAAVDRHGNADMTHPVVVLGLAKEYQR